MRHLLFAMWGALSASGWWAVGTLNLSPELRGLIVIFGAIGPSLGLLIYIVVRGVGEE